MDEPEQPPPHAGERLTRQDVERLIEEHGGPAGLDLRQADLREAVLTGLDLHGAELQCARLEKAHLVKANFTAAQLQGCWLSGANLQRAGFVQAELRDAKLDRANLQDASLQMAQLQEAGLYEANLGRADLSDANLQGAVLTRGHLNAADLLWADLHGAHLWSADLRGARLRDANLRGTDLRRADLRRARLAGCSLRDANLEDVNWGDYVLGDEIGGQLADAASAYRTLKQWHTEAGMYDIAGEFHYREMEARRKEAWGYRRLPYAAAMYCLRFLYGYGERPWRIIGWAAAVVFGLALVHWAFGTVAGAFWDALYYSAVSFTALGYGKWAPEPQGWAGRFLGAGESFVGVFMMALFLVTFTRKMTR